MAWFANVLYHYVFILYYIGIGGFAGGCTWCGTERGILIVITIASLTEEPYLR